MKVKPQFSWQPVALIVLTLLASTANGCQPKSIPPTESMAHEHESYEISELSPVALDRGRKLKVVATTNIVGDVVSRAGGDRIELTTLMGTGTDPHSYVPTPAATAALHDAHVIFANGAGLEGDLQEMLESSGGNAVEIHLSHGLRLRAAEGSDNHGGDPHVWFDVQNVIFWVETIEQTLNALDPANAKVYGDNAEAYVHELEELDTWVMEQVATIPESNRKFVTNHPAFGYLAARYGLQQVGAVYPISPSSEPSAQDLAGLEKAIREYGVPAIFTESTVNPALAEQVAQDTDIKLLPLFSGSLGGPDSGVESYIELMRYDVNAIVKALR